MIKGGPTGIFLVSLWASTHLNTNATYKNDKYDRLQEQRRLRGYM